ncbi:hypothetical protein EDB81DRAFT_160457 [Dactylonectria macrodidyma]|uniref:C3H1-type domain-containing protein n=1 Tax=Dactylonectria macrodidyma TaxID=307937 RepID=A0A9P9FR68_9HYPO|nr:hypothetical protein EDB81DRAFT_160457 [Dactylonectria macrodidyma]
MEHIKNSRAAKNKKKPCHQFQSSGACTYGESCRFGHQRQTSPHSPAPAINDETPLQNIDQATIEPMDEFFARYPNFQYKRDASFWAEFHRLSKQSKWKKDQRREHVADFKTAITHQFNNTFGTDETSLESWQKLCRILGVGVPNTLKESRLRVQRTHVNLVDLVESPQTGKKAKLFPTVEALREYTLEERKVFPREEAHAGGLLKMLLRQIFYNHKKTRAEQPTRKRVDSGVDLGTCFVPEGSTQSV